MQNDTAKARTAYQHFLTPGKTRTPTSPYSVKPKPNNKKLTATAFKG